MSREEALAVLRQEARNEILFVLDYGGVEDGVDNL